MTRKDYVLIANVIASVIKDGALCMDNEDDARALVKKFADILKADNMRFDVQRFAKACGVGKVD